MVTTKDTWRKKYHKALLSAISCILGKSGELPEYLELPISTKTSMFEFGGSKYSSGTAMVVATPSGFPNAAIALKQRKANGLHAASRVWIGSLVGIAHHQFGVTTAGVYQLVEFTRNTIADHPTAKFKLITGICQASQQSAHDLRWIAPYDHKYRGIKKLVTALLLKLERFECRDPIYLEPFRVLRKFTGNDPDFNQLMDNTDLDIDRHISELIPRHIYIKKNLANIEKYDTYAQFEAALINACGLYSIGHPFVYALLCHHMHDSELHTCGFVCSQLSTKKPLLFHRTGFLYRHTLLDGSRSNELESYIESNYNKSYFYNLIGAHGGRIDRLLHYIASSKDACHYVPLKYALCTKSYR